MGKTSLQKEMEENLSEAELEALVAQLKLENAQARMNAYDPDGDDEHVHNRAVASVVKIVLWGGVSFAIATAVGVAVPEVGQNLCAATGIVAVGLGAIITIAGGKPWEWIYYAPNVNQIEEFPVKKQ